MRAHSKSLRAARAVMVLHRWCWLFTGTSRASTIPSNSGGVGAFSHLCHWQVGSCLPLIRKFAHGKCYSQTTLRAVLLAKKC